MIWIISPLVLGEISGVFLNTLTSDGKYPVQACENLQVSTQMQLAEKRKLFSEAFLPFLVFPSNFEHFDGKDDRLS